MKVIEDTRFCLPHQVQPVYNGLIGKFIFQLRLDNQMEYPLHFYIASTFGCCLQQTSKARYVDAKTYVKLTFELKSTNILGNVSEMVVIYGSRYQSVQLFSLDNCYQARTKLIFNEDNSVDAQVEQILKISFEGYIKEANQFKINKDYVNSLKKYEQAYETIRMSDEAVKGMIDTRFMLNDYAGVMRDIESVLVRRVDDPLCFLLKVKLIMRWQKEIISEREEVYNYIQVALKHINQHFHFYFLSVQDKAEYQSLVKQFKSYKRNINGRNIRLFKRVYNKAIDKYQQNTPISKYFKSKEQFQRQLKQLLLDQNNKEDLTPQQVLDPISYQIMKKPYILPSGNSCEQQSLRDYFKINGYKDPITRLPINYTFIFPNLNLEKYIKQNPKLKIWERYEYDFIHN